MLIVTNNNMVNLYDMLNKYNQLMHKYADMNTYKNEIKIKFKILAKEFLIKWRIDYGIDVKFDKDYYLIIGGIQYNDYFNDWFLSNLRDMIRDYMLFRQENKL